jgi:hypothetical protein
MFLNAAYTGNRGNFLPAQLNPINQLYPGYLNTYGSLLGQPVTSPAAVAAGIPIPFPGFVSTFGTSATVLQALKPYPQYANIFNNFDDTGSSLYNAMQIQVEKRYTSGLSFLVSYGLSKMMSNTNSGFTSFAASSLNKTNQKAEWSIDNNDQTNSISIAGTYELPFGKGRPFMNKGGWMNVVFGGWQISPILTYATGTPLWTTNGGSGSTIGGSVVVNGDPLGNGCTPCNRANIVPNVNMMFSYNNVYKGLPVINAAAFSDPGPWVLGTAPRVIGGLRNPWGYNENVALAKYFPLGEKVRLKLEIEYFNLLNRVVFGNFPSNFYNLDSPSFGMAINSQFNTQRQGQGHIEVRW